MVSAQCAEIRSLHELIAQKDAEIHLHRTSEARMEEENRRLRPTVARMEEENRRLRATVARKDVKPARLLSAKRAQGEANRHGRDIAAPRVVRIQPLGRSQRTKCDPPGSLRTPAGTCPRVTEWVRIWRAGLIRILRACAAPRGDGDFDGVGAAQSLFRAALLIRTGVRLLLTG